MPKTSIVLLKDHFFSLNKKEINSINGTAKIGPRAPDSPADKIAQINDNISIEFIRFVKQPAITPAKLIDATSTLICPKNIGL